MTVLSVPADLVAGLRTGDEQALEHGFQEIYPALLSEVDSELHDLQSSSRVVERAVLQVLAGPPIEDAAGMTRALDEALHHAVVREQSRRAALRRFEHNEHVALADRKSGGVGAAEAWKHIHDARFQTPSSADPSASRHAAAGHLSAALNTRRRWSIPLLAVGLIALCAAAYGLMKLDTRPSEQFVQKQLAATSARVITAGAGQIGSVALSDDTQLRIAAKSLLRVVPNYGSSLRALSIAGSASITVGRGRSAVEIRAPGVAISATDGTIDVSAEQGEPTIVRVVSGGPRISVGDSAWVASAGDSYVIDHGIHPATPAQLEAAFAWTEGRFVMTGTVRDVVAGFRRWYDTDVGIVDNATAERRAQVTGSLESLSSSLESLKRSARVNVVWDNAHMLLYSR
jgi:ferric-dicitrate binding protein FerR (iron transport regulator)